MNDLMKCISTLASLWAGRPDVLVLAPTEERKRRAAEILRQHGRHFINFFGRLAVEQVG
jgi:hypothetical protein